MAILSHMDIAPAHQRYHPRLRRVITHIDVHLAEDLGVETLAAVAAFSPFHFQRQFAAMFGISVGRYVQLQRLRRASFDLAFRAESIANVAMSCGYAAPEAFARAFRRSTGQSPSSFRDAPDWNAWHATFTTLRQTGTQHMTDYSSFLRIIDIADISVAAFEHRGDPRGIGESVRRFIAWRKTHGLAPSRSRTFNVFHTPIDVDPAEYRMDICVSVAQPIAPNDESIVARTIAGGRVAVIRHAGPDASMAEAFHWLYATWLPQSGEELRDFPPYLERLNFYPDVPECEAAWQAFLPLAAKPSPILP